MCVILVVSGFVLVSFRSFKPKNLHGRNRITSGLPSVKLVRRVWEMMSGPAFGASQVYKGAAWGILSLPRRDGDWQILPSRSHACWARLLSLVNLMVQTETELQEFVDAGVRRVAPFPFCVSSWPLCLRLLLLWSFFASVHI